ncbi:hypothetical protein [Kineothrix sedimenti]|uniref:Bacteriophage holin of superfamily 6 (Holin_LLH) n=1 Tax=Kineothrix sedimenti TaxID=3123317 RepID=A0ABZ3F2Y4_9FIRM
MEFLINYWYVIVAVLAILVVIGVSVYKFAGLPTKEQITKIKEWLLYAVTVAESELGSNTGSLKLRAVYDMFVTKFPVVAKIVSFETFSTWVDEALEEMRKLLETNEAVKQLVDGGNV